MVDKNPVCLERENENYPFSATFINVRNFWKFHKSISRKHFDHKVLFKNRKNNEMLQLTYIFEK